MPKIIINMSVIHKKTFSGYELDRSAFFSSNYD